KYRDDFSSIKANVDNIKYGVRNLRTISNTDTSADAFRTRHTYFLRKTPSSGNPWLRVADDIFEDDTYYVVTFKSRKLSGDVKLIGGHAAVAENSTTEIYLDGELITEKGSGWSNTDRNSTYPNDFKTHHHEIRFKTVKNVSSVSNARWYIQPNRGNYGDSFEMEVWDWQVEKGTRATDWSPAPEDLVGSEEYTGEKLVSMIEQTANSITLSANKINFDGHVFGRDATFAGNVEARNIVVNEGDIRVFTSGTNEEYTLIPHTNMVSDAGFEGLPLHDIQHNTSH